MSERKPYEELDNDASRRGFIEGFLAHSADMGDGAFWALAEEVGIDAEELTRLGFASPPPEQP